MNRPIPLTCMCDDQIFEACDLHGCCPHEFGDSMLIERCCRHGMSPKPTADQPTITVLAMA
jgi:hypothetical protein